jgi:diguanylate cyclase (GGDEF)-like protein/PAS domain S-box-containing protein
MNKKHFIYSIPMILLLIVVIAGWFATKYLGNQARQEIISESRSSLLTLSTYVSSTFTIIEGAVKSLAGSPWIAPALLSKRDQNIEHADSALDRYNSALNASVSYLMDANGITVTSTNRKDPDSFVGKSYRFRPYFQEAAKGQLFHYFALGITSGKRGFYASYPVQNRLGKVIGVVTMKKDLDDMGTFFRKYPFCFLISPDGIIFLSSKPEMVLKSFWPLDKTAQEKLIASRQFGVKLSEDAFFKKKIADGTEVTLEGKDYFVSRKIIESSGWSIVLLTTTDRIWSYKLIGILATIFVCLLIIIFAGIIYLADRSQKAIRQSEESKRLLLNAVGDGIFVVDTLGRTTFVNPAAQRMLGFAEEETLGQSAHALVHHSHEDGSNYPVEDCPMYASYAKATEGHMEDEVFWRKDGSYFHVDYFSTPIAKDGKVEGAVVTFRDVTKRKQAEEALLKSEIKYRTILETIQEGYFEVDLNGNLTFFNDSICRLLGYTQEEMIGMNNRQYTDKEHSEILYQAFNKVYSTGKPAKEFDWQIIRKDGTKRDIEVSVSLQINSSGKPIGFRGIARDITEHKMMEAEILALSITDQLTGLYNRRGFLSLAEQQLKLAKRNKSGVLLFFIDLDGLKWINDTLGHEEGDKALIETATVFKETFRASDIIARLGGDEYAALAIEITETNSEIITGRLQSLIDTQNNQENRRYRLSISVGCSYYDPENPCSIDELISRADKLMYEQKKNKKSRLPQTVNPSSGPLDII